MLRKDDAENDAHTASNALGSLCVLAGIAIFWRDIFTLMPAENDFIWTLSSAALLLGALAGLTLGRRACFSGVRVLSSCLVVLALLKITTLDTAAGFERTDAPWPVFNLLFGCQFALLVVTGAWHWITGDRDSRWARWHAWAVTAFLAMVAFIALITLEFMRVDAKWCRTAITLWWALCGLVLAIGGLVHNIPAIRYAALVLFGITIFKVFMVDLSGLDGIMRIAAFIGVGLLLLLLSYVYQKLSPKLIALWDEDHDADNDQD